MQLSKPIKIIEPRITTVTSIRDRRGEVIGWKMACHKCHTETQSDNSSGEYERLVNYAITHQCRKAIKRTLQKAKKNLHSESKGTGRQ